VPRVFNRRNQRVSAARLGAPNIANLGLEVAAFAGHSLRAGFVTSAVKGGAHSAPLCQRQPRDVGRQIGRRGPAIDGAHEFDTRHQRDRLLALWG
jgi:hypothetical protein